MGRVQRAWLSSAGQANIKRSIRKVGGEGGENEGRPGLKVHRVLKLPCLWDPESWKVVSSFKAGENHTNATTACSALRMVQTGR